MIHSSAAGGASCNTLGFTGYKSVKMSRPASKIFLLLRLWQEKIDDTFSATYHEKGVREQRYSSRSSI
jgi:hypothetical protein